jgi:hypothetical protein
MKCQEIPGFPGTGGGAACALENGGWRFPAWACATPLVISCGGDGDEHRGAVVDVHLADR